MEQGRRAGRAFLLIREAVEERPSVRCGVTWGWCGWGWGVPLFRVGWEGVKRGGRIGCFEVGRCWRGWGRVIGRVWEGGGRGLWGLEWGGLVDAQFCFCTPRWWPQAVSM